MYDQKKRTMNMIHTMDAPINQSSNPKLCNIRCRTHKRLTTRMVARVVIDHITAIISVPLLPSAVASVVEPAIADQ
jgi:hypothetical protein